MFFQPIPIKPALFIPNQETVVISDLHIGIENELSDQGVHAGSQIHHMESMVEEICSEYHPKNIIILGDIKHSIPSTPFYEKKHLYEFIKRLQQSARVEIIPGNHDGGIKAMAPESVTIHPSDGCVKDSVSFIHGHRWPSEQVMQASYLFCGHTHPIVKLTDNLGYHNYELCWIKTPIKNEIAEQRYETYNKDLMMVIVPAFNPLCGGIAVNDEGFVGPIKHLVDTENAEVYLLDGTFIGTINHLKNQ